jgi:SAM-dependent methyltransferase
MTLKEGIALIKTDKINSFRAATWADLGCGSGLFTYALAGMLNNKSTIYAIDKNITSFKKNLTFKSFEIIPVELDFEKQDLPFIKFDGILMANSLHFIKNKNDFIKKIKSRLNRGGLFLVVEYDTEAGNHWVPYPITFEGLKELFAATGFPGASKINERPSVFNSANLYSAIAEHT